MTIFTKTQTKLLTMIIGGLGSVPASENAALFRADNEQSLDELDALEQMGIVTRENNKYSLSVLTLVDMAPRNTDAHSIVHLSSHLFDVIRRLYKANPGQPLGIEDLARAAEFPQGRVQRALSYLAQAPRLWSTYSGPRDSIGTITPSEGVLRYRDFEAVVEALRQEKKQVASNSGPREKQQKFGILDSPALLAQDLDRPAGVLGRAVIYLDLDDFKQINTQLTEVVVDRLVLPPLHNLLARCVASFGSAYAEGGDEFTIHLPNASESMAVAFAEALRGEIASLGLSEAASDIQLTASIGVAYARPTEDGQALRERANIAKKHAKETGKNRVSVWSAPTSSY
jgi:diguanylate cyclase (GGDEF)-like protein